MEVRDVSLFDLAADPGGEMDSLARPADLADVDRLIFDLVALVEAGLVEVREPVFGPARYGALSEPG